MNKLSVGAILGQAFLFPANHWREFVRIALAPAVYGALWLAFIYSYVSYSQTISSVFVAMFGTYLVGGFLIVAFIVSWHRLVLLGAPASHRKWFPLFQKRDFRFVGYVIILSIGISIGIMVVFWIASFLLSLPFVALMIAFDALPNGNFEAMEFKAIAAVIVLNLFFLGMFSFICHWLLILPGVTVDEPTPFALAGELIKENRWRFFSVIAVVTIIVYFVEWALFSLTSIFVLSSTSLDQMHSPETSAAQAVSYFVKTFLSGSFLVFVYLYFVTGLAGSAVFATALSASYRKLKEFADARPSTAPGAPA